MQPAAPTHSEALPLAASAAAGDTLQFLTFTIGDSEYAIDIMQVREVKGWSATTRLPGSPDFMRGVLNLRGIVIPIVDLRCRFGLGVTQATEKHVIIILNVRSRIAGLLVDSVSDILSVQEEDIKPTPEDDAPPEGRLACGLIAIDERMVVTLRIDRLLAGTLEDLALPASAHQH